MISLGLMWIAMLMQGQAGAGNMTVKSFDPHSCSPGFTYQYVPGYGNICSDAEPQDVPAVQRSKHIQREIIRACSGSYDDRLIDCRNDFPCDAPAEWYKPDDPKMPWQWVCVRPEETLKWWTCTDRRRVLLTDESGKRHCILFGGGQ